MAHSSIIIINRFVESNYSMVQKGPQTSNEDLISSEDCLAESVEFSEPITDREERDELLLPMGEDW